MKTIKITYANGDTIITQINGTHEEIEKYYLGNIFNIGSVNDNLQRVVSVQFI